MASLIETHYVEAQYAAGIAAGRIEPDDAQKAVVDLLARLESQILQSRLARKSSSLGWLFARSERRNSASRVSTSTARSGAARPC